MRTQRLYGVTLAAFTLCTCGILRAADSPEALQSAAEQHERPLAISQAADGLPWVDCPALFPPGCKMAVLHGNPSQPAADIFLRVPSGYTIPAHSHTSAERMILVTGQLEVTYAGHATVSLQRGDYAYGPPKLPHTARCNGPEACTLFIAFNSAVDALPFAGAISKPAR